MKRNRKKADTTINQTKRKFMLMSVISMFIVLFIIFLILDLSIISVFVYSGWSNLNAVEENSGVVSAKDTSPFNDANVLDFLTNGTKSEYIYVSFSEKTNTTYISTNLDQTYSRKNMLEMAELLKGLKQKRGIYGRFMYSVRDYEGGYSVSIIDMSNGYVLILTITIASAIIFVFSMLLSALFSHLLSKWAIQPAQEALTRQKRFVSDASHELKTPLAVIQSSAEVLENEVGKNKWIDNIQAQSKTMNAMIYDLLDLAKLDETSDSVEFQEFNLSEAVMDKCLEFEAMAFEAGKKLEENIPENIKYVGNESLIKQMVGTLVDNAIKHSDKNGSIRVTLMTSAGKKIIQVFNTGAGFKESEKELIFERFYRSDQSRNRETGGYGLGLSIAKSIVDLHGGTISCDGEEGKWISFTAEL